MPKNPKANQTILNPATSTGDSLRTTIPSFIKNQFKLEKGDSLEWGIDGDHLVARIVKKERGD
jgi:antitoxin component of MazEF toxin-antitoxin module